MCVHDRVSRVVHWHTARAGVGGLACATAESASGGTGVTLLSVVLSHVTGCVAFNVNGIKLITLRYL